MIFIDIKKYYHLLFTQFKNFQINDYQISHPCNFCCQCFKILKNNSNAQQPTEAPQQIAEPEWYGWFEIFWIIPEFEGDQISLNTFH